MAAMIKIIFVKYSYQFIFSSHFADTSCFYPVESSNFGKRKPNVIHAKTVSHFF